MHGPAVDEGGVAAPVDADHAAEHRVLVGGAVLGARTGALARRAHPDLAFVPLGHGGSASPHHRRPALDEVRHRLADRRGIGDDDPGHGQRDERAGHHHAVVGVGVPGAGAHRAGAHDQSVVGLLGGPAEPVAALVRQRLGPSWHDPAVAVTREQVQERLLRAVRRCPPERSAPALTLLASFLWGGSAGALATEAAHRALEVDPGYRLARLVASALQHGVRPQPPSRPWPQG